MPSLAQQAQAIADRYHREVPTTHALNSHLADPDTIAILLEAVGKGLNNTDSCLAAGLNPITLGRWIEQATQHPDSVHAVFVNALKRARSEGKLRRLQRIERAADDPRYWASNAWILERTDPEQFALRKEDVSVPQVVVQIGVAHGDVKVGVLSPPTFAPPVVNIDTAKSLETETFALPSSLISDVPLTNGAPCQLEPGADLDRPIPAVESPRGPHPTAPPAGGQDSAAGVKGGSVAGPRKKKRGRARAASGQGVPG